MYDFAGRVNLLCPDIFDNDDFPQRKRREVSVDFAHTLVTKEMIGQYEKVIFVLYFCHNEYKSSKFYLLI